MGDNRVEALAGLALGGVLLIAVGGLISAVLAIFAGDWVAGGLCLIASAIPFSTLFHLLYK